MDYKMEKFLNIKIYIYLIFTKVPPIKSSRATQGKAIINEYVISMEEVIRESYEDRENK